MDTDTAIFEPDFLLIPRVVHKSTDTQPADWLVYGAVYWYEHMKEGRCRAGNEAIGKVAGVGERAVRGALERLEAAGFIKRTFHDKARRNRKQIYALVSLGGGIQMPSKDLQPVIEGMQDDRPETPREFAKRFFDGEKEAVGSIGAKLEAAGIPQTFIVGELLKFRNHWTELTPNGKKQKWELERTFEVERRLGTWFRNAAKWSVAARKQRAGAGVTI